LPQLIWRRFETGRFLNSFDALPISAGGAAARLQDMDERNEDTAGIPIRGSEVEEGVVPWHDNPERTQPLNNNLDAGLPLPRNNIQRRAMTMTIPA
jgi:hypothetical protein